jgi:hypothetical protein
VTAAAQGPEILPTLVPSVAASGGSVKAEGLGDGLEHGKSIAGRRLTMPPGVVVL